MRNASQFYQYQTMWELFGAKAGMSIEEFSQRCVYNAVEQYGDGEQANNVQSHASAERKWLMVRRPYYKLHPAYAVMLTKTSLDIPVAALKWPHEAFAIFLPKTMSMFSFVAPNGHRLDLRSILCMAGLSKKTGLVRMMFVMDDGEPSRSLNSFDLVFGNTVEQCLCPSTTPETSSPMARLAVRLTVAVMLLATSVHRCVEHDVIRALRERYDNATTDEEREHLADKSRRRGVNGWNVGRGRCLGLTTPHGNDTNGKTARELNYQHVRGGHFHTVRHGPGHSLYKVMFFEPTIVRPDLQPPPLVQHA